MPTPNHSDPTTAFTNPAFMKTLSSAKYEVATKSDIESLKQDIAELRTMIKVMRDMQEATLTPHAVAEYLKRIKQRGGY